MLVSAISATHTQAIRPVNYGFVNSRGGDSGADTVVNDSATANRKSKGSDKDSDVYTSINEWKAFCHKQIAGGKLNIIA